MEVTIPYDTTSENNEERVPRNTLINARRTKTEKYARLLEHIRTTGAEASLHVIVISSLGGIEKETKEDLRKLLRQDEGLTRRVLRRCVINIIKGSSMIYNGCDPRTMARYMPTP